MFGVEVLEGLQAGDGVQPQWCKREQETTGVAEGFVTPVAPTCRLVVAVPAQNWHCQVLLQDLARGPQQSQRDTSIQLHCLLEPQPDTITRTRRAIAGTGLI